METNLTEEFFDRLGKDYEEAYANNEPLHELIEEASKILPPEASILDVGSGTGKPVASMFAADKKNFRVHGIDRSKVMIDLSREQVPQATFERVDMMTYSPGERFDAIFAIFVFFALSRPQYLDLLSNFSQWLKPNGVLYLGALAAEDYDPDPEFPIEKSQWDSDGMFVSGVEHKFMGDQVQISMLSRAGWALSLDQTGFEVIKARGGDLVPAKGHLYGKHDYYYIRARKKA